MEQEDSEVVERLELVEKNGCLYAMKEDGTMLNIL